MSNISNISNLIDILRRQASQCHNEWKEELEYVFTDAADTIESLNAKLQEANVERSAENYGGGWIPCTERLPENLETVIAFTEENEMVTVARNGQVWVLYDGNIISEQVVAWQPLPSPYHEP